MRKQQSEPFKIKTQKFLILRSEMQVWALMKMVVGGFFLFTLIATVEKRKGGEKRRRNKMKKNC